MGAEKNGLPNRSFATLEVIEGPDRRRTAAFDGNEWFWSLFLDRPMLTRDVAAGEATLMPRGDRIGVTIRRTDIGRDRIEHHATFDDLVSAALAAETFAWHVVEYLDLSWYEARDGDWTARISAGNLARVTLQDDGSYSVARTCTVREGEIYEFRAMRYNLDRTLRVNSFREAAAIAVTLPAFAAAMMAPPPAGSADRGTPVDTAGQSAARQPE